MEEWVYMASQIFFIFQGTLPEFTMSENHKELHHFRAGVVNFDHLRTMPIIKEDIIFD